MQQVVAQFVLGGQIGGLAEPLRELADGAEVGLMSRLRESGELQVREHLLGAGEKGRPLRGAGRDVGRAGRWDVVLRRAMRRHHRVSGSSSATGGAHWERETRTGALNTAVGVE